jgi:hypothetical protein
MIFFAAITGPGQSPEDNIILDDMITGELIARNYLMLNNPQKADFLLYGTLDLYDIDTDYVSQIQPAVTYTYNASAQDYTDDQMYIFQLILRKADTGDIILQNIIYNSIEDIYYFFPVLTNNLIIHMGGIDTGEWTDTWLNVGGRLFWSPRVYYAAQNGTQGGVQSVPFDNFGGGVSAEAHLLKFLSVELGVEFVQDRIGYSADESYQNLMLEIPFAVKYIYKFSNYAMIGPYAGVHVNVPLNKTTEPPLAAWMVGFTGGIRVGRTGIVFFEPRFSMDIGPSKLPTMFEIVEYQRITAHIGIGYKYGFFTK